MASSSSLHDLMPMWPVECAIAHVAEASVDVRQTRKEAVALIDEKS